MASQVTLGKNLWIDLFTNKKKIQTFGTHTFEKLAREHGMNKLMQELATVGL